MALSLHSVECGVTHPMKPGWTFAKVTFKAHCFWEDAFIPVYVPLTHEDQSGGISVTYDEARILNIARSYVHEMLQIHAADTSAWSLGAAELQYDNIPPGEEQPD